MMRYYYHALLALILNKVASKLSRLHRWGKHARTRRLAGRWNLIVGRWSNHHEYWRDRFKQ